MPFQPVLQEEEAKHQRVNTRQMRATREGGRRACRDADALRENSSTATTTMHREGRTRVVNVVARHPAGALCREDEVGSFSDEAHPRDGDYRAEERDASPWRNHWRRRCDEYAPSICENDSKEQRLHQPGLPLNSWKQYPLHHFAGFASARHDAHRR